MLAADIEVQSFRACKLRQLAITWNLQTGFNKKTNAHYECDKTVFNSKFFSWPEKLFSKK